MNNISKMEIPNIHDSKLSMFNTIESLLATFLTIMFFICFNPFYALVFSSILNIFSIRIHFNTYAFLFSLAFALLFTNRDPATGGDVLFYILRYIDNTSFVHSVFNGISEPIWGLYERIASILISGSIDLYVLLTYFLLFLLFAILAKSISRDKYVIVLFIIIFFNLSFLYGAFQIWRNTFAILLLFIGIYSSRGKILLYFSPLIQVITLPFVFLAQKFNFKSTLIFIFIGVILTSYIAGKFPAFSGAKEEINTNFYFVAIAIMIMTLSSLKLIQLNYIEKKIFTAMILFIVFPFFLYSEVASVFSIVYQRTETIFMFFGSIIVAKIVIKNYLISIGFIFTYFIYRFLFSFKNPDIFLNLIHIGDERPLYIYNGIYMLINGYQSNRWSEYVINNSDCVSFLRCFLIN
jgi:hypothetical protein